MDEENHSQTMYLENHKKILARGLDKFLSRQSFVDMTLVCEKGTKIKLHRAVLAACSPYLEHILIDVDEGSHPVLVFSDISEDVMVCIIEFMYKGQTEMNPLLTESFLNTARKLQIRGLESHGINVQGISPQVSSNSIRRSMSGPQVRPGNTPTRGKTPKQEKVEVKPQSREKEKIPLSIKTETGVKVLNPFALKDIQNNDSASTDDDLCVPGPSKADVVKEADSSRRIHAQDEYDSDVEFIEDNHSIVVVESQRSVHENWLTKVSPHNKRLLHQKDSSGNSSDSETWTCHQKKKKTNAVLDDEEPQICRGVRDISESPEIINADSPREAKFSKEPQECQATGSRDKSESPEIISATHLRRPKVEPKKTFSDAEYVQMSFHALRRYCPICRTSQKKIRAHFKKQHAATMRRAIFICNKCHMKFYMKYTLKVHKCKAKN